MRGIIGGIVGSEVKKKKQKTKPLKITCVTIKYKPVKNKI